MKHIRRIATLLLLSAASHPVAAQWQGQGQGQGQNGRCELLAPTISPASVSATYDPFDAQPVEQAFTVDMRADDCPPNRALFLKLRSDEINRVSGRQITLQSGSGATLLASVGDRGSNDSTPRGVGGDHVLVRAGANTLYLIVARGQLVPPGVYRADLTAEARTDLGQPHDGPSSPLALVVNVMPSVGLAAATGGMTLDFGVMSDGAVTQPVTFDAYANVDYELSLVSDNGFRMKLDRAAASPGVPYRLRLDGSALAETGLARFAVPPSRARRRHALEAQVPSVAGAAAGHYRDAVTVTISPRVAG